MIPDDHQAAVRQEGKRFGSGNQLIGLRRFQYGFIHIRHSFRKHGFPQGGKGRLLQVFLVPLEQENGRDLVPGQGFLPEYDAGEFISGSTAMIVNRGAGKSILPLRIGNPPEIVVLDINRT